MADAVKKSSVAQNNILMLVPNENYADIKYDDNAGAIYKKPSDDALYWKSQNYPDELNLTTVSSAISALPDDKLIAKINSTLTTDVNTDYLLEGKSNLYFTTTRARAALTAGDGISYDSSTGVITNLSANPITSITGTANQILTSASTGNVVISLPQAIATTSDVSFKTATLNAQSQPLLISNAFQSDAIKINNTSITDAPSIIGFYNNGDLLSSIQSTNSLLTIATNNNIYMNSLNNITFKVNNNAKVTINSSGVGIGETNPQSLLHLANVNGDPSLFSGYSMLLYNSGSAQTSSGIGCSNGALWFNSSKFSHYINNDERLIINSNGVGVNINPIDNLHVRNPYSDTRINCDSSFNTNASYVLSQNSVEKFSLKYTTGSGVFSINQYNVGDAVIIDGNNNVGIGGNPSAKLSLTSSTTQRQFTMNDFFDISVDGKVVNIASNSYIYNNGIRQFKYSNSDSSYGSVGIIYNYPNANEITIYNSGSSSVKDSAFNLNQLVRITSTSSIILGGNINTNSIDGFIYIPIVNGAPTSTPSEFSGKSPILCDGANNRLYIYNNGWKYMQLN